MTDLLDDVLGETASLLLPSPLHLQGLVLLTLGTTMRRDWLPT